MMKQWCGWCLATIENTPTKYANNGNMCKNCSERVARVLSGRISEEEADRQLEKERKINIKR